MMHKSLKRKAIGKKGFKKIWNPRQVSYIWATNVRLMKKSEKNKPYKAATPVSKVQEPAPVYRSVKVLPIVKDFTYSEFKKIADKAPFTQAEWAAILHVSERTLQRYAKDNSSFAPMNAERALQIDKVLKEAKVTFGKVENFYTWIKRGPYMLEGNLSFDSLTSYSGIEKVLTQLGRIQHGLFA
jgi:putative toxin-antitoxin system antitoxin component (TIGR02293 family)